MKFTIIAIMKSLFLEDNDKPRMSFECYSEGMEYAFYNFELNNPDLKIINIM
jgi:hypothetical protein